MLSSVAIDFYIFFAIQFMNFIYLYFYTLIYRSLSYYIVLTYFSKLLRMRFLTHYTLITSFCKPVVSKIFNTLHSADSFF